MSFGLVHDPIWRICSLAVVYGMFMAASTRVRNWDLDQRTCFYYVSWILARLYDVRWTPYGEANFQEKDFFKMDERKKDLTLYESDEAPKHVTLSPRSVYLPLTFTKKESDAKPSRSVKLDE